MMLHQAVAIALVAGALGALVGATLGFYAAASAHEKAMRREARMLAPEPPHIRIPNPPTPPGSSGPSEYVPAPAPPKPVANSGIGSHRRTR